MGQPRHIKYQDLSIPNEPHNERRKMRVARKGKSQGQISKSVTQGPTTPLVENVAWWLLHTTTTEKDKTRQKDLGLLFMLSL